MVLGPYKDLRIEQHDRVFVITLQKAPENRINVRFAQEIIRALRDIETELGPDSEGCVITRGNDEADTNPFANSDGFFPVRYIQIVLKSCTTLHVSTVFWSEDDCIGALAEKSC
jgi:enoyl-CoA hydratase/carnithine racemase